MIESFIKLVRAYRFSLNSEAALKREMVMVMERHGLEFFAEAKLDEKSRPDFMVDGYAIEVKIKGNAKSIYKQCERYAAFPEVRGVVLVSNRAQGFPDTINGKPAYFISLGSGWL